MTRTPPDLACQNLCLAGGAMNSDVGANSSLYFLLYIIICWLRGEAATQNAKGAPFQDTRPSAWIAEGGAVNAEKASRGKCEDENEIPTCPNILKGAWQFVHKWVRKSDLIANMISGGKSGSATVRDSPQQLRSKSSSDFISAARRSSLYGHHEQDCSSAHGNACRASVGLLRGQAAPQGHRRGPPCSAWQPPAMSRIHAAAPGREPPESQRLHRRSSTRRCVDNQGGADAAAGGRAAFNAWLAEDITIECLAEGSGLPIVKCSWAMLADPDQHWRPQLASWMPHGQAADVLNVVDQLLHQVSQHGVQMATKKIYGPLRLRVSRRDVDMIVSSAQLSVVAATGSAASTVVLRLSRTVVFPSVGKGSANLRRSYNRPTSVQLQPVAESPEE